MRNKKKGMKKILKLINLQLFNRTKPSQASNKTIIYFNYTSEAMVTMR